MIPIKLHIKGFLSYQENVEIDFTGFNLACISGTNGAGKSSLLDAITWVLFGKARRNDDAIINSKSDAAEVSLEFQYEGETYLVLRKKIRNKTTTLDFQIRAPNGEWKTITENSKTDTETLINDTLKMRYETFINASFFLQGKADQFAQQGPSDRKRILGTILGLEKWDTYQKQAKTYINKIENDIYTLAGSLSVIDSKLKEEPQRKEELLEVEFTQMQISQQVSEDKQTFERFVAQKSVLQGQIDYIDLLKQNNVRFENEKSEKIRKISDLEQEINEVEEFIKNEADIEKDYLRLEEIRIEKDKLQELSDQCYQIDTKRQKPLEQIDREFILLKTDLEKQIIAAAPLNDILIRLSNLERTIQNNEETLNDLNKLIASRPLVDKELSINNESTTRLQTDNGHLSRTREELQERIDKLKVIEGADCPLCGQFLTDDHRVELLSDLEMKEKAKAETFRNNLQELKLLAGKKQELEIWLENCKGAEVRKDKIQTELNKDTIDYEQQKQKRIDSDIAAGSVKKIQELLENENFSLDARFLLASLNEQIDSLGFDNDKFDAIKLEEKILKPVEELRGQIVWKKEKLGNLMRDCEKTKEQLIICEAEYAENSFELETKQKSLDEISEGFPDLTNLSNKLKELENQETQLKNKVGAAQQKVLDLESQRIQKTEFTKQQTDKNMQVYRYRKLEKAFGKNGIQALLIEQALPEIEEWANEILDRLSEGKMSVRFETQKEYSAKNREDKQEILDILISDGTGDREYELFSGGEAFRVNFAIRLALSKLLAHRAGARLQTLVIDEGFGSQDEDGRQRLIESINLVQSDFEKILVITHLEELKENFPARIEVEKTSRGSTVSVLYDNT